MLRNDKEKVENRYRKTNGRIMVDEENVGEKEDKVHDSKCLRSFTMTVTRGTTKWFCTHRFCFILRMVEAFEERKSLARILDDCILSTESP